MANVRVSVPQPAVVTKVTDESNLGFTGYAIWLDCGHIVPTDADDNIMDLVGAETICNRHFEWIEE